jgi:anti-sigma factor RsiW
MRHVTDGELHTYLDGALDLLPEGRGDEVRQHLEACPVCSERLQDEERVREQAQSLLGSSAPEEVALPPFEELRARAEAAGSAQGQDSEAGEGAVRYRGPLRGTPLAWAATVVLALGVGWMGGEVWRGVTVDELPQMYFEETQAQPAADLQIQQADLASESREGDGEAEQVLGGVEGPQPAARARMEAPTQLQDQLGEGGMSPAASLQTRTDLSAVAVEDGPREIALENSLLVPGLEVLSVEWKEWVPGEQGLHIRQLVPPTDTLELRYLGLLMGTGGEMEDREGAKGVFSRKEASAFPPSPSVMAASLPRGWNQVVMKKGRGWLVARATIPEASIRALLRSLR